MNHRLLDRQEDTRFRVLRPLEARPRMGQRELGQALGISSGKVHYCHRALLDKGWVRMQKFHDSQRKQAYLYLLTLAGVAAKTVLTLRFLQRKMADYDRLRAEMEALRREMGASADFAPTHGGGMPE